MGALLHNLTQNEPSSVAPSPGDGQGSGPTGAGSASKWNFHRDRAQAGNGPRGLKCVPTHPGCQARRLSSPGPPQVQDPAQLVRGRPGRRHSPPVPPPHLTGSPAPPPSSSVTSSGRQASTRPASTPNTHPLSKRFHPYISQSAHNPRKPAKNLQVFARLKFPASPQQVILIV
jgi:hypothetical protein